MLTHNHARATKSYVGNFPDFTDSLIPSGGRPSLPAPVDLFKSLDSQECHTSAVSPFVAFGPASSTQPDYTVLLC